MKKRKSLWTQFVQSWWGRMLAGAFIGGLLVAFSGITQPSIFLLGMLIGALALLFLGQLK